MGGAIHAQDCFVIGVSGPSSSGKKTVCGLIRKELEKSFGSADCIVVLHAENFYKPLTDEEQCLYSQGKYNFDQPNAYDFELLERTIKQFRNLPAEPILIPSYDFSSHARQMVKASWGEKTTPKILLVEGIFLLYEAKVRGLLDMRVFVDVANDVCLTRRVLRECEIRKRPLEQVLLEYLQNVKPGFENFIMPTKKFADLIIPRGSENTVAISLIVSHIEGILNGTYQGASCVPFDTTHLSLHTF